MGVDGRIRQLSQKNIWSMFTNLLWSTILIIAALYGMVSAKVQLRNFRNFGFVTHVLFQEHPQKIDQNMISGDTRISVHNLRAANRNAALPKTRTDYYRKSFVFTRVKNIFTHSLHKFLTPLKTSLGSLLILLSLRTLLRFQEILIYLQRTKEREDKGRNLRQFLILFY